MSAPPAGVPAPPPSAADAGSDGGRREPLAAVALFAAGLAAGASTNPGPAHSGLAWACVALAAAAAWRLRGGARLLILAAGAAGFRIVFRAAGLHAPFALPAELLHPLAYYSVPPLLLDALARAFPGRRRAALGPLQVYAPLAVVLLGAWPVAVLAHLRGEPAGDFHRQLLPLIYGGLYVLLAAVVLLAGLSGSGRQAAAPEPADRAAEAEQSGRFGVAARLYEREHQFQKGAEMAEKAGEWARAAELYRRSGDPFRAAEMFYRAGGHADAVAMYEEARAPEAAARVCEQAGWFQRAAALHERAGRQVEAVRVLEQAGLKPPAELYYRAGRVEDAVVAWQEEGHWARAAEVMEHELRELDGAAQRYLYARQPQRAGQIYEALGRRDSAIEAYLQAPDGAFDAARLCLEAGEVARALDLVERISRAALEALEDEAALRTLARVYEQAQRVDEAIRILQRLRRRPAPEGAVSLALGRCLMARGLHELAERELRIATELCLEGESALEAAYRLGCALEALGRKADAAEAFDAVLQKDLLYRDAEARYRRLKGVPAAR